MGPVILAYCAAGFISVSSAVFGVALARLVWADDLKHAREIDVIRSKTEIQLRNYIKILEDQIKK